MRRGRGPRDVLVRKYPRWVKGRRKRVGTHVRGIDPKLSVRKTPEQLDLGL
jgi:hypothetical protein